MIPIGLSHRYDKTLQPNWNIATLNKLTYSNIGGLPSWTLLILFDQPSFRISSSAGFVCSSISSSNGIVLSQWS